MRASSTSELWHVSPGDKPAGVHFALTGRRLGSMKTPTARAAALESAGLGGRPAFTLKQVHGTTVVRAKSAVPPEDPPEADGWVTDVRAVVLAVYAADCMPIFMWNKAATAVGVFHAGWRGLERGMPRAAVAAFGQHFGIGPGDLRVAIGPHIGPCCFRVGPEFRAKFKTGLTADLHLDMAAEVKAQIGSEINVSRSCTSCEREDWFSFRREKRDSRMMAFISLDP